MVLVPLVAVNFMASAAVVFTVIVLPALMVTPVVSSILSVLTVWSLPRVIVRLAGLVAEK